MSEICDKCGKSHYSWTTFHGERMCTDCAERLKNEEILNKASESDSSRFFKDWSSRDRTTAFFETFGRYIKNPSKKDITTIMNLWLWACHDDHGLVKTISYTFKWAKMELHTEYNKWIRIDKEM